MSMHGRERFVPGVLWLPLALALSSVLVTQGFGSAPVGEMSLDVQLDEADNATRSHLERADRFLADRQWDEAVETLCAVMESSGDKLLRVPAGPPSSGAGFARYLTLRDSCQLRLGALAAAAPQALRLYRQRVDPLAERWYQQALAEHEVQLLRRIAERAAMSSCGDDTLLRLGEWELEQGRFTAARAAWERLSPLTRTPRDGGPDGRLPAQCGWGRALHGSDIVAEWPRLAPLLTTARHDAEWLAYPDSSVDLAAVRARLVLVSILEGSPARAERELQLLRRLHPEAAGMLAGRRGRYAELLADLLQSSRAWPAPAASEDWPTFAGSPARDQIARQGVDVALRPLWTAPLPPAAASVELATDEHRVAEGQVQLLSYHPLVVDRTVLVATGERPDDVLAYDLETGRPLWSAAAAPAAGDVRAAAPARRGGDRLQHGVPRYTLTAADQRLFVKLGAQATIQVERARQEPRPPGYLAALDLTAQKKLLFEIHVDGSEWGAGWALEGAPLVAGERLYVALRRCVNVRSQAHVACFRLRGNGARLRWRKLIVSAETPGQGEADEYTHNLLTLDQGTLYYNSNLGAVAALRADDGLVQWLVKYPRSPTGRSPYHSRRHWLRSLNPCLVHKDLAIVAPSDCDRIFALDAATGFTLWSTLPQQAVDAVHLLGVAGDTLIASGNRLYWIDVHRGEVVQAFPARVEESLGGFGRGILAGEEVYWPTRDRLYVFHQRHMRLTRQPVDLACMGLTGGNLVVSRGVLLIAGANQLAAFNAHGPSVRP
jgi:outer membrane protein assembly factor BamB